MAVKLKVSQEFLDGMCAPEIDKFWRKYAARVIEQDVIELERILFSTIDRCEYPVLIEEVIARV